MLQTSEASNNSDVRRQNSIPKFSSISTFNQYRKSRSRTPSSKFLNLVPQGDGSKFSLASPAQDQGGKYLN